LFHLLLFWFYTADDELTRLGVGDGDRRIPGDVEEGGARRFLLRGGDQEGQASGGGYEAGGRWEDGFEALYGSDGYYVEGEWGEGFGADVLYIDVRKCKSAGYFAEEGRFLLVGFD
jgi:hypothetical protein